MGDKGGKKDKNKSDKQKKSKDCPLHMAHNAMRVIVLLRTGLLHPKMSDCPSFMNQSTHTDHAKARTTHGGSLSSSSSSQ